ncbi:MAG TPA: hypothetical protein VHM24_12860, partial [Gemmatimonadaceae bacterium]|nr:hypothetical protein [Gemmatimonadaceae bacterium]
MKRMLSGAALMGGATAIMLSAATWTTNDRSDASAATAKIETRTAPATAATPAQIARGRFLVISHDCGGCHGGGSDPSAKGWLAGTTGPQMEFKIGPCSVDPAAKPCFTTRPRNLTPDNATGTGRFTERQIFNALRYGLRPGETP